MEYLVIIPARGGSKGIPHKNIKELDRKPLIYYTIDCARKIVPDENICVSSDDPEIIQCVEDYGLKVPFIRPAEYATDTADTYEVLLHAVDFYEKKNKYFDAIILLHNTTPFRTSDNVKEALSLYNSGIDMVVSVKQSDPSPYYNCFEEGADGYLKRTIEGSLFTNRQDAPITYEYNSAIYIINTESLKRTNLSKFTRRVKYVMDALHSIDLDNMIDWKFAEFVIKEGLLR